MDYIEKLIETIKNKKCITNDCKDEILKLNILTYREEEKLHPGGHFNYVQYYLDKNNNLNSTLEFQYRGRY